MASSGNLVEAESPQQTVLKRITHEEQQHAAPNIRNVQASTPGRRLYDNWDDKWI